MALCVGAHNDHHHDADVDACAVVDGHDALVRVAYKLDTVEQTEREKDTNNPMQF